MKQQYKFLTIWALLALFVVACSDDDDDYNPAPGNPVLSNMQSPANAFFGDSIPFSASVDDNEIALSTLKVRLYYGEDLMDEQVIRTKTPGTYSGKVFAPFLKDVDNGTAILEYVLQNVSTTITSKLVDMPLERPDYPYLTLISGEDKYRMERIGLYQYEVTDNFPIIIKGYIEAPVSTEYGNPVVFGRMNNDITQGTTDNITFSNEEAGEYSIGFNTFNYEAYPFIISYAINGVKFEMIDDYTYKIDLELNQGQQITFTGFDEYDMWIDPDFFEPNGDGTYTFVPADGKYRITADLELEYFKVDAMSGNDFAVLNSDGTGAIWLIGDDIGKPLVSENQVGWDPSRGLLMPSIGNKKFRISFVGGETIKTQGINFKFFHIKDWDKGEFNYDTMRMTQNEMSEIFYFGGAKEEDQNGNMSLVEGKTLTAGKRYVFTIDVSAGNDNAILTIEQKD